MKSGSHESMSGTPVGWTGVQIHTEIEVITNQNGIIKESINKDVIANLKQKLEFSD